MNLQDQLKNLFPDLDLEKDKEKASKDNNGVWLQDEPLLCKYEKRNGKVNTIISGYNGSKKDFKELSQILKKELSVGGSVKNEDIIIQGDFRDKIMEILKEIGFSVKRVGG